MDRRLYHAAVNTSPVRAEPTDHRARVSYSFLKILTGSDLSRRRLAVMRHRSGREGPVVWLTGCAHGDEVGGMVVIQEVFKRLRRRPLLMGELNAFPLMNPMGFEMSARHIGVSTEDLNRCYPGNPAGSLAHRIAHTIFSEITATVPTLVLDLHNDWRSSIPYTVLDPPPGPAGREAYARAKAFARHSGFLLIAETRDAPEAAFLEKTLSGSLLHHGVPALTLELGEAHVVNEINIRYGVSAVWNLLLHLGMVERETVEPATEYPVPPDLRGRFLTYTDQPVSPTSGIIRFAVNPGDRVQPGQPLAKIYNAFGKLLETIRASQAAVVLGHSDSSVAFPGEPMLAFGVL